MTALSQDKTRFRRIRELTPQKLAYWALGAVFVIAAAITITAIVESYSNQVDFALNHQMPAWHGRIAPIAVDAFILLGELLLFAGILLRWRGWGFYAFAASLALGGFTLSVAANIWHAPIATDLNRAIQALWPVAATAALAGALLVCKRLISPPAGRPAEPAIVMTDRDAAVLEPWPAREPAAAEPPPAPGPVPREPRRERAARAPELAAAQAAAEKELALELAHSGKPWPSARKVADDDRLTGSLSTRRRAAERILAGARSMSNGAGHDDRDGA